jgi:ubiquinone/menaquinone biosynthesis C-methylase UbiE
MFTSLGFHRHDTFHRFGCKSGYGISLSPFQIQRAKEFTEAAGLTSKLTYQVADAMNMPFSSDQFDLSKCIMP